MEVGGQLQAPVALSLGERFPHTHLIGAWVGPRGYLDVVTKRKNLIITRAGNRTPIVQSNYYTEWATQITVMQTYYKFCGSEEKSFQVVRNTE
jgi:hypothetical protein